MDDLGSGRGRERKGRGGESKGREGNAKENMYEVVGEQVLHAVKAIS